MLAAKDDAAAVEQEKVSESLMQAPENEAADTLELTCTLPETSIAAAGAVRPPTPSWPATTKVLGATPEAGRTPRPRLLVATDCAKATGVDPGGSWTPEASYVSSRETVSPVVQVNGAL